MKKILFLLVCMVMTLTANAQEIKKSNFNYKDIEGMWCSVHVWVDEESYEIDYEDVMMLTFTDKVTKGGVRLMAITFTTKDDSQFITYKLSNGTINAYKDANGSTFYIKLVIKNIVDNKYMLADVYLDGKTPITMGFYKYKEL